MQITEVTEWGRDFPQGGDDLPEPGLLRAEKMGGWEMTSALSEDPDGEEPDGKQASRHCPLM